ncbi:Uncharacterized conserved protein [Delftia tsuruhatensis]|uniref:DcrB-related protein n=1 Tax=Delftia tsuruhatensis TaxID=180282 RepID=UPI001E6A4391|nr:DcrB-related protein [Delftia tsuruhatensis]CAB5724031.1 Uncharacterized conserved protein [Delftia tsuruhatensis]CAC9691706.1 Uncharacterized conserved protein [Delftia tsuruhatensis]
MPFAYRTNEALIEIPGELQRDESMNIVHFLTREGRQRRMIISREMLPGDADFDAIVREQVSALKKEKLMKVGEVKSMVISGENWPAISIDAYARMGKEHAWQFHIAFHWAKKYLITVSLNAKEEMSEDEKTEWVKTVQSFKFDL